MAHRPVETDPAPNTADSTSRWWWRNAELRPQAPAYQRVVLGARNATLYFAVFYPLLLLLWLIGGRHAVSRGMEIDTLVMLVAYPPGVALMGAIAGLLVPFMRTLGLALLSGIVAIAPLMCGISLAIDNGWHAWGSEHTVIGTFMTLFFGAIVGKVVRDAFYDDTPPAPTASP
jgi:hypothetical protein